MMLGWKRIREKMDGKKKVTSVVILVMTIGILVSMKVVGEESRLQQRNLQQQDWELLPFPLFRKYPQAEGRFNYIDPQRLKEFVKTLTPQSNPSMEDVKKEIVRICQEKQIPPHILFGIAWTESRWRQFDAEGYAIVSPDGGLGMMQLTDSTLVWAAENIAGKKWISDGKGWTSDKDLENAISQLAGNWKVNLEWGAKILLSKWNSTPSIGNNDRSVIEHWYYAVWAYNGWSYINNPNNTDKYIQKNYWRLSPRSNKLVPYQEYVFDIIQLGSEWNNLPWNPIPDLWRPLKDQIGDKHPPNNIKYVLITHKDADFDGVIDYILQILRPTSEQVANAGPYNKPSSIQATIKVLRGQEPVRKLESENFVVLIGGKKANATANETGEAGTYSLSIRPPQQPQAGKYDLVVRYVSNNQVIAEAGTKEAVEYIDPALGTGKVELVLIIDSSGSMSWNDPDDTRKDHAKRFIDFARVGDRIGIVDFDEDAVILANLTEISTDTQRRTLKSAIDQIDSSGATNIEDGLWKGLQVLDQGAAGNIKVAILLTDGQHNTGPIGDAIKQYAQRGIRLYTIALTGDADEALLRSYAEQTGGRYLKAPTAAQLDQIWREIIGAAIGERSILTASFSMKQGDIREQPIPVDSTQEVLVAGIIWSGSNVKLTLIRPDGSAVDPNTDTTVEYNRGSDFEIYRVHSPAAGQWTARIEAIEAPDTGTQVKLTVATTTPLVAEAFPLKTTYFTGEAIVVAVSLFEGDQPVIGAQVEAKITKPGGKISRTRKLSDAKVERDAQGRIAKLEINVLNRQAGTFDEILPLFDDGLHNDGAANDGVYANIYKATTNEGTYIFNITATGTDSKGFPFRRELIVTADVSGTAPALFEVTPTQIDLGTVYVGPNGAISTEQLIRIVNQSNETQSVLITSTELLGLNDKRIPGGYLSVSPSQFVLDPGAEATVSLNLNLPIAVESGEYAGNLVLAGNAQNQQVPLRFKVETDSEKPRIQDLRPVSGSVLIGPQILTMIVDEAQAGILFDKVKVFVDGQEAVTDISYDPDTRVLAIELWLPEPALEGFASLAQAQQAGWIEDYAWGWEQDANNPNTGRYVLVYDTSIIPGVKGQLEPWKGYWVYAHTDCELILPPPSQSKGRGTRGEGRVAKGNGWSMRLQASVNGSVGEAVIGIANGTRGLAVGLPPEPPTGNNGVQVILLKNNTPLAVDVRSDGSRRQEWEVLVRFGTRDGGRGTRERKEVVLTFDGIGYAPKDVSAWLVDTVTGKRLYLRTQPSYRFVAQEGEVERKFKVVVERGNDRPLRVVGLKATPMRGQGVVIEFSLTKPAKVEAEVLTLTGRRVAVLDAGSSEGLTRRVVWRGVGIEGQKVGSGVYLVRVRAVDEEGREVQAATVVRLPEISNPQVSPTKLRFVGGEVTISAVVSDPSGVERVWAVVQKPDGTSMEVSLSPAGGDSYRGTVQVGSNTRDDGKSLIYRVWLRARDRNLLNVALSISFR